MPIIGIDPAFRKSGFAICIADYSAKQLTFKRFKSFWEFVKWLLSDERPGSDAVWAVEDANLMNVTFIKSANQSIAQRLSRNAGANQAVSALTVEALIDLFGREHVMAISPREKGAKLSARAVAALFHGFQGVSTLSENQDFRDAAKIASIAAWRIAKKLHLQ